MGFFGKMEYGVGWGGCFISLRLICIYRERERVCVYFMGVS